jgi:hypothetical protein
MKTWIIAALVIGLLVLGTFTVMALTKTTITEAQQPAKQISCSSCGNSCNAESGCGLATCGATTGGSCGCGKA